MEGLGFDILAASGQGGVGAKMRTEMINLDYGTDDAFPPSAVFAAINFPASS